MDFEQFAPARDFWYLASVLGGAGIGCILNRFKKNSTRHSGNWALTIGFCFFSGAVTALTVAVIYSRGLILLEASLYPYLGLLTGALILAFRFPRTMGFPLFLLAGVLVVWMGYIYLRFPGVEDSGKDGIYRITREGNEYVHLLPVRPSTEKKALPLSVKLTGRTPVLEFRGLFSSFSRSFPFVGGVVRGTIVEIKGNDGSLYEESGVVSTFLPDPYKLADPSFFSFWEVTGKLEMRRLPPGTSLTIFLRESDLVFR